MEEEFQTKKVLTEYKYKTEKIERWLTVLSLVFFYFSFNSQKIIIISFFAFAVVVFVYYFVWFRKKPAYIIFEGDEITIHQGFFFKPREFKKEEIKSVKKAGNRFDLETNAGKKATIYQLLLSEEDYKDVYSKLKNS